MQHETATNRTLQAFVAETERTVIGALDAFLIDCEARRLAVRTLAYYRWEIGRFADWLAERGVMELADVVPTHVRAYLVDLQRRGLRDTSQHDAARAIRAWCNWLEREEIITRSPMRNVGMPRVDRRILPAFTPDDVGALLRACIHERDRVLILCLLDTGCRASEFIALNLGDVNPISGVVMVHGGKGGKDRRTRIGNRTRSELQRYVSIHLADEPPGTPLWRSLNDGGRLTIEGLQRLLRRVAERAEVGHCHPHTFRRTCALWMHRDGADMPEIAALLGHSDLATLRRYLDIGWQDAERAHVEHGPVDQFSRIGA